MTKAATKQQQRAPANANAKTEKPTTTAAQSISSDIFSIATDFFSAGRSGVQANTNTNALGGVKERSVQRARQLRKDDSELYKKVQGFFVKNDIEATRAITSKSAAKREQVDSWVRGAVSGKAIACLTARKESQPALFALLLVSSALTKYGERELVQQFKPSAGVHKTQQTKQQPSQVETRETAPSGPKTAPQNTKQQNAQQTKQQQQAGRKACNPAQQQQKTVHQALPKAQTTQVKAQVQVQAPPPAPVSVRSSKTVKMTKTQPQSESQKEWPKKNVQQTTPLKGVQLPIKNVTAVKNAWSSKNMSAAWAGPLPATVLQSGSAAIVSSAPGRASVIRANRA